MKREYGRDQIVRDEQSVVTVGTFDGVHVGHRAILQHLTERAQALGGPSVVVSFDPHPREVVQGEPVPLLTTPEERGDLLEELGVDRFVVLPFTEDFRQLGAEEFVEQILVGRIGLGEIVVGYDHSFGKGREGDSALLEQLGVEHNFRVEVIPAQAAGQEQAVSSSQIRTLLVEEGEVEQAGRLLGRRYALSGTVIEGDKRGRKIGFPTANLDTGHPRKLMPKIGVYAVRVERLSTSDRYGGMMNIGVRPTFEGTQQHLEVHLFDFDASIYGEQLRVEFARRIRDEQKFDGVEALTQQLSEDRTRCKKALAAQP